MSRPDPTTAEVVAALSRPAPIDAASVSRRRVPASGSGRWWGCAHPDVASR